MKRNRKYCKYNRPRGRKTSYCDFLGDGLQCYKVCNMYVETREDKVIDNTIKLIASTKIKIDRCDSIIEKLNKALNN